MWKMTTSCLIGKKTHCSLSACEKNNTPSPCFFFILVWVFFFPAVSPLLALRQSSFNSVNLDICNIYWQLFQYTWWHGEMVTRATFSICTMTWTDGYQFKQALNYETFLPYLIDFKMSKKNYMHQTNQNKQTNQTKKTSTIWKSAISICAESWDYETVGTVEQSKYINMCKGWGPWNGRTREAV